MAITRCPYCNRERFEDVSQLVARIRKGTFTGLCYADRGIGTTHSDRLARPDHPAVQWDQATLVVIPNGRRLTKVTIICPRCETPRLASPSPVAAKIREGKFTGLCLTCSSHAPKSEWVVLGPGRKYDPDGKGYIRLGRAAISDTDLWLYDAMRERRTYVLEHRLVMARVMGRPLTRNELVDHRDGVKTNNAPDNLRLYRRGKNDDGSGCGYGTFYDEWQRAEAEVRRLRALLA